MSEAARQTRDELGRLRAEADSIPGSERVGALLLLAHRVERLTRVLDGGLDHLCERLDRLEETIAGSVQR